MASAPGCRSARHACRRLSASLVSSSSDIPCASSSGGSDRRRGPAGSERMPQRLGGAERQRARFRGAGLWSCAPPASDMTALVKRRAVTARRGMKRRWSSMRESSRRSARGGCSQCGTGTWRSATCKVVGDHRAAGARAGTQATSAALCVSVVHAWEASAAAHQDGAGREAGAGTRGAQCRFLPDVQHWRHSGRAASVDALSAAAQVAAAPL